MQGHPHALPFLAVAKQLTDSISQFHVVIRWDQKAGFVMSDNFRNSTYSARDDGSPRRTGFQYHDPKCFTPRG